MPAMFAVIHICSRYDVCALNIFLCDKGNSIIERTREEKYSIIKDVVIQYCQIQHSVRFEAMCNFVIQHGCTQFSGQGTYIILI